VTLAGANEGGAVHWRNPGGSRRSIYQDGTLSGSHRGPLISHVAVAVRAVDHATVAQLVGRRHLLCHW
jgi:hypothetical protein